VLFAVALISLPVVFLNCYSQWLY